MKKSKDILPKQITTLMQEAENSNGEKMNKSSIKHQINNNILTDFVHLLPNVIFDSNIYFLI